MGKRISVNRFMGMSTSVPASLLPDNRAQYCENVDVREGALKPWGGSDATLTLTGADAPVKTLYRFAAVPGDFDGGNWFNWNEDVDVIKGPVPGDSLEMTYFTGFGDPKFTDNVIADSGGGLDLPNNSFLIGIPTPSGPGSYAVSGTPPATEDLNVNRTYAVTYVGARGEEGPPAYSASIEVGPEEQVDITSMPTGPGGNYDLTHKRIYRTAKGSGAARFFLVAQVTLATTSYSDTKTDAQLGVELVSQQHAAPPAMAHSIGLLSNGIVYMCKDNRLALSEAYLPYAYNALNEKSTDYPIVGAGNFGNTIVVLTERAPWMSTGSDPRSMNLIKIEDAKGCVAKRSIASHDMGVVYAAENGLMLVGRGGVVDLTRAHMTEDQWRAYAPSSMHGTIWNNFYVLTYDDGSAVKTLMFNIERPEDGFTVLPIAATAWYADRMSGRLHYTLGASGDPVIYTFDIEEESDSHSALVWESKDFIDPTKRPFTAARIIAESYTPTITLKVYHDGSLVDTKTITSAAPVRLTCGSGVLKHKFRIEVASSSTLTRILQVDLAETVNDLFKQA